MNKKTLKFRIWDENKNSWINYSNICFHNDGGISYQVYNCSQWFIDDGCIEEEDVSNNNNFIIEQSTGLYDNSGKMIYEGDIIKDKNNHLWTINFDCDEGRYSLLRAKCQRTPSTVNVTFLTKLDIEKFKINIIGNIHENEELINKFNN